MDACESLLGGFVADRTRLCDIMFPEGETTTFGFDCAAVDFALSLEWVDFVGEDAFPSVGVGGVIKVVGASIRFGFVTGRLDVTMRLGAVALGEGLDCVSSTCICGSEA